MGGQRLSLEEKMEAGIDLFAGSQMGGGRGGGR